MERSHGKILLRHSLKGKMLFYFIFPLTLITAITLGNWYTISLKQANRQVQDAQKQTVKFIAAEIEKKNMDAVKIARFMAMAQVNSLFGNRLHSSRMAQTILHDTPEIIGAYFGYEPNSDGQDSAFLRDIHPELKNSVDKKGRFLPYWFKDFKNKENLVLEPLVDMESSLYYNGVHELYKDKGVPTPMVTEPYVYEGRMIVEQTYPIIIDDKFVGIAGVDRALDDIEALLKEIKLKNNVDVFLISRKGRFIASTIEDMDLKTILVSESPYAKLLGGFYEKKGDVDLQLVEDPVGRKKYFFDAEFVPTGDWVVVVSRSEAALLAPIRKEFRIMLLVAAAGLSLMALFSLLYVSNNNRKINEAVEAVDKLALGDTQIELKYEKSRDEFGAMFRSFEKLIKSDKEIAKICSEIANGNFEQRLESRGSYDKLTESINTMSEKRKKAEIDLKRKATQLKFTEKELMETDKKSEKNIPSGSTIQEVNTPLGVVAHELNTPLGVSVTVASHLQAEIMNVISQIESNSLKRSDFKEFIEDADKSCHILLSNLKRAAKLIKTFKKMADDQSGEEIRELNIGEYFSEILLSIHHRLKSTKVQVHISAEEIRIKTDPGALAQILTNLIMNSIVHGFDEGNRAGDIWIDIKRKDNMILIDYQDTGSGMAEDVRKKVFEPFFTTRERTGGTGLGMNIVYNLVTTRLKGEISCISELKKGATFAIKFPIVGQESNLIA